MGHAGEGATGPCDCGKCEQLLQDFVDRDLSADERRKVEGHLDSCGHCARYYRLEETLRRHVRRCCDEQVIAELASSDLKARLRSLSAES